MSIALVVTRGFGNGTLAGDVNDVVTRGYTIGEEVAQVSPCPDLVWSDAAQNASVWYHQNPTETVWDAGGTNWDLVDNVYLTLFDVQDTVWSDAATNTATYGVEVPCEVQWDSGSAQWDLDGNVYMSRWK